jgi:hypothetical protein
MDLDFAGNISCLSSGELQLSFRHCEVDIMKHFFQWLNSPQKKGNGKKNI